MGHRQESDEKANEDGHSVERHQFLFPRLHSDQHQGSDSRVEDHSPIRRVVAVDVSHPGGQDALSRPGPAWNEELAAQELAAMLMAIAQLWYSEAPAPSPGSVAHNKKSARFADQASRRVLQSPFLQ